MSIPEEIQQAIDALPIITDDDQVLHLVTVIQAHFAAPETKEPVALMRYWAGRVIEGDDGTAGGSMDLDYAHDELSEAARTYLGVPTVEEAQEAVRRTNEWVAGMAFGVPVEARPEFLEALVRAALGKLAHR
jgi:hypothetical protein